MLRRNVVYCIGCRRCGTALMISMSSGWWLMSVPREPAVFPVPVCSNNVKENGVKEHGDFGAKMCVGSQEVT